ncbi:MAG: replication-relaxation family protein [Anaerolineales bacterium]|nr:replication-relaxation family protein [Anaerolineales bacterium]
MPIDLSTIQDNIKPNPNQLPIIEPMSSQAAQIAARNLLQHGLSKNLERVIALLLSAGVLPQYRIPMSGRVLRQYHQRRVLDRLPFTSDEVRSALMSYGLPVPDNVERSLLYTLGPVGIELVRERYGFPPPGGFLSAPLERLLHDLAVNEIVFRLGDLGMSHGWTPTWLSKYEATLWSDEKREKALLEPDAFLRFRRNGQEWVCLVEFHNEDKRTRAIGKARKYESALQSKVWAEQWEIEAERGEKLEEKFPPVLAIYREGIVGKGYQEEINDNPGRVRFYGRSLEGFFQDPTTWYDFRQKAKAKIFPWEGE